MPDPRPPEPTPEDARTWMRGPAARAAWVLALGAAYAIVARVAEAWARASAWDFRAHAADPLDGTWRLALGWLAAQGDWSYLDFPYPRGPGWQAVAGLAYTLSGGDPGWTHALTALLFELLAMAALLWVVLRRVRAPWPRTGAGLVAVALSSVVGAGTLRAALPLLVADALVPREDHPERPSQPWRAPAAAAGWTVAGLLLGFDRLYAAGLAALAVTAAAAVLAARGGAAITPPLARLGRYLACLAAALAALSVVAAAAGASPLEIVVAQRRLAVDYAAAMVTEWEAPVPPWIAGAFAIGGAVYVLARRGPSAEALLVAGALPGLLFGMVRADEEHLVVAALPVAIALLVAALRPADPSRAGHARRGLAVALAALAIGGWVLARPRTVAFDPDGIARLLAGEGPDRDYRSDAQAAVAWARSHRREGCLGASADVSVIHAMADARGPTELPMRWTHARREALATAIAEADCPRFLYSAYTFVWPGNNWVLGPDFVEVARRYEPAERVAPSLLGLRRRAQLREVERRAITEAPRGATIGVPGSFSIELGEAIGGTDVLELPLRVDVSGWRQALGGAPAIEWRFERAGEPVGEWRPVMGLVYGEPSTVQLAPDPDAAEWRWIGGRSPSRTRSADALVLRARARGWTSPAEVRVEVGPIARLRLADEDPAPGSGCRPHEELRTAMRGGAAWGRYASPRVTEGGVELEPNDLEDHVAELWLAARPCADSCVTVEAMVDASESESDGVEVALELFDPPGRHTLEYLRVPAGRARHRLERRLDVSPGRDVLVGLSVRPWESWGADRLRLLAARVGPCVELSPLAPGRVRVSRGEAVTRGEDLALGAGGATLGFPMATREPTCLALAVRADRPGEGELRVWLREGDEAPYVHRLALEPVLTVVDPFPITGAEGGNGELTIDVALAEGIGGALLRPRLERCP